MADLRSIRLRDAALSVVVALLGPLVLAVNIWALTANVDFTRLSYWRRLWNDLALATANWVEATQGPATEYVTGTSADDVARGQIIERIINQGLRPTRPLERVRKVGPFLEQRIKPERPPYDDRGRSVLLGIAFRLRGGIAPFLILWLGFVVAAPELAWIALELRDAGRTRMAIVSTLLLGLSPFLAGALSLGRYPVGFYLAALLLIPPLAVYGRLNPSPTIAGLLGRVVVASALLAVCVFCRSSAGALVPGFVLAVWLGAVRVTRSTRARLGLTAAAALLLTAPTILVPGSQQNDMWQPVWEGLGDFDRTHGFTWADKSALDAVQRAGGEALWTDESEVILRAQVLDAIKTDPFWYAGILVRRLLSTVSLWRLWPWTPVDGDFIHRSVFPNEGVIDKYWTYTPTADFLGIGDRAVELPIGLMVAPSLLLIGLSFRGRWARPSRDALAIVACIAVAAAVLPVLVTTAGGQEGQSFALVHLFSAAFLVNIVTRRRPATAAH